MDSHDDPDIHRDTTSDGSPRYEVSFEDGNSPPVVVAETVAALEGADPTELAPIHDVINAEAVERLFAGARERGPGQALSVSFTYEGYGVTIDHPGTIELVPLE